MAQPNLLDIVPDQLFQTYYIGDIINVQKKIQYEIERKREDLRAMVGEKYRDLIQAADTIEEMKVTTASTLNHINEMIAASKELHHTHLVGFKIDHTQQQQSSLYVDPVKSISVQVKLLMEIPEKIWGCIDEKDFINATQLYIMARHVNTGLQLQIGGKSPKPGMESIQRLIHQHWSSISYFNKTIIDVCKQKLQDVDITVEVASSCLISLYLLDSQSMSELLNTLIVQHSNNSLKSTLQFELTKLLEGDIKSRIKEKIVNGVKIVLKTIVLMYSCFVDQEGGAVIRMLNQLYSKDSQPLIELVNFSDPTALKLLPPAIGNYRLTTTKPIERLTNEDINKHVVKWNDWVKGFIEERISMLLQNVTRVKVLHEIREEAFKVEIPHNWSSICSTLNTPEVHVWSHYYQPLMTRHVKHIIDNRWSKLYDVFKTQMLVDLSKVSSESEFEKEADLNWFVWKDMIGDTVIESRTEVVKVMSSLMKGMWLQDRGFTPTLEKLCKSLDTELQKLLEDLKFYLYSNMKNRKDKTLFFEDEEDLEQIYNDRTEIEEYLRDVTDKNVDSMLQYIKACFEESTLQTTVLQKKSTAVYTARFLQSCTNLVPCLRNCYINDINHVSNREILNRWERLCACLKENSLKCWGKWVGIALAKIEELTSGLPQEFTIEANVDYLMMQWDVINIQEKDDEGNSIQSTIKVPYGPSLKLQEYLYASSRILDEIIPHTLPNEVHTDFIEKLSTVTLGHYNKVIREKETDINQRCALQLLMDVRHLTLLLVPRENKKCMEFSQEICEFLRQKIDPFDYDVFYPHIQTNLKRSVQRVQTLLGSLILKHGQVSGIVGTSTAPSTQVSPTILASSAPESRHWLSLLPVPRATSRQQKKKPAPSTSSPNKSSRSDISELMTGSLPLNFANARSGAASFFNSMTSDWFSGS